MSKEIKFTPAEKTLLYELAKICLSDGEVFDIVADTLDIADNDLKNLQVKLEKYLDYA